MPYEPTLERIEKRLEKIDTKIDIIMTNCIPTLQSKTEYLDGRQQIILKVVLGIAIGFVLSVIGIICQGLF